MNTRQYLTGLRTILLAMAIGQILFAAAAYFFLVNPYDTDMENAEMFLFIVPAFAAFALFGGFYLFTAQVKALRTLPGLAARLKRYQVALLVRSALAEGAALLAIVAYMMTAYYLFIVIATLTIFYFVLLFPTVSKIAKDLALEPHERLVLENGEMA